MKQPTGHDGVVVRKGKRWKDRYESVGGDSGATQSGEARQLVAGQVIEVVPAPSVHQHQQQLVH